MWRIIRFLTRFGNLLLVVFLELVALLIVVSVNKPHRELSQGIFGEISGSFSSVQASISGYFNLSTENEKLLARNSELESELLMLKDSLQAFRYRRPADLGFMVEPDSIKKDSARHDSLIRVMLPDSLMPVSGYQFIPCRAINHTVHLNYNYITLNKGENHGVKKDMGIISPEGIAGQVVGTSPNFSLALSVLNRKFRTSARVLRNSNLGTLLWEGSDPEFATLEFIPQTSLIAKGDTIVTSGFSTVFPPDYMVGTISSFDTKTQDGFYHIRVKLSTQFRALDNLFLVRHAYKTEIDSVESLKTQE